MIQNNFHKDFKLNGFSFFSVKELLLYSKSYDNEVHIFLEKWFDSSKYLIVYSSGSTGKPKSIKLKKKYLKNSAKATGQFFDLYENTTSLLCLPIKYIAGKMMLVRAMVLGWNLDIVATNSNPLKNLNKEYDFSAMIPMQVNNSLDNLDKIKILIVGGGSVSNNLQSEIMNLQSKIYATYGMTETVTHIAIKPLNKSAGLTSKNNYFQTLPQIKISQDNRNCLVIDAPKLSNKNLITNDIVELISDDKFKWLGRYDHVINSGGIKLIPEQIEEKLVPIISERFFITSLPDEVLGEKLILIVEGNIQENLKSQISNLKSINKFEIPKEIHFVKKFLETKTKKIQRQNTLDLIKF